MVLKKENSEVLTSFLNSIDPDIKYTTEEVEDGDLAFLATNIKDGSLKFTVYQKETSTN